MRGDLVRLDAELRATSTQDDFAKWARLRRKLDKMQEEYKTFSMSSQHSISPLWDADRHAQSKVEPQLQVVVRHVRQRRAMGGHVRLPALHPVPLLARGRLLAAAGLAAA